MGDLPPDWREIVNDESARHRHDPFSMSESTLAPLPPMDPFGASRDDMDEYGSLARGNRTGRVGDAGDGKRLARVKGGKPRTRAQAWEASDARRTWEASGAHQGWEDSDARQAWEASGARQAWEAPEAWIRAWRCPRASAALRRTMISIG